MRSGLESSGDHDDGEPIMSDTREKAIRERAYALWEKSGSAHGQHGEHWDQAVREIDAEAGVKPKSTRRVAAKPAGASVTKGKPGPKPKTPPPPAPKPVGKTSAKPVTATKAAAPKPAAPKPKAEGKPATMPASAPAKAVSKAKQAAESVVATVKRATKSATKK